MKVEIHEGPLQGMQGSLTIKGQTLTLMILPKTDPPDPPPQTPPPPSSPEDPPEDKD